MLSLDLFLAETETFQSGTLPTLAIYAGLGAVFFILILFLQQVAGYTPLQAGAALLPTTILMFLLSRRFGGNWPIASARGCS